MNPRLAIFGRWCAAKCLQRTRESRLHNEDVTLARAHKEDQSLPSAERLAGFH